MGFVECLITRKTSEFDYAGLAEFKKRIIAPHK